MQIVKENYLNVMLFTKTARHILEAYLGMKMNHYFIDSAS
jgi:isocitrate/isopropylmalate dehydrogenase